MLTISNGKISVVQGKVRISSSESSGGGGPVTDPEIENVRFLMDWEDSGSLLGNPNLGTWVGTPTYTQFALTSSGPITGDHSLITTGPSAVCIFSTWDAGTSEWTMDLSTLWNGVTFPATNNTTSHDLITDYNATGSDRALLISFSGNGVAPPVGQHRINIGLSNDGLSIQEGHGIDLGEELLPGTKYYWSFERHGDNINVYLASGSASQYSLIESVSLTPGFSIHHSGNELRVGIRESAGNPVASGRYDDFRYTQNVARHQGNSATPLVIPHPRT